MARKGYRLPPEVYTSEEVSALLATCNAKCPTGARNKAMIALMYRGGFRVSEVLSLYPQDLDPARGTAVIRCGKGKKFRTIGLDEKVFTVVNTWLEKRALWEPGAKAPLFCTKTGEKIDTSHARRLMAILRRKAGIKKRVHCHGFRHTHAAELAREKIPMNLIQNQLGHSNLATTNAYLQRIAPEELISVMRKRNGW